MKKIVCSVLLCASALFYAQSGTLSGNINDDSKIALPGAKLTLSPFKIYTTADDAGNFVFLNVPARNYTHKVDYFGYAVKEYPVTVTSALKTIQNVIDDRRVQDVHAVTIIGFGRQRQARALNLQKNNPNISNVVASGQIGKFPDANIGNALKGIPDFTMQNDQDEARNIIARGLASQPISKTVTTTSRPSWISMHLMRLKNV